MRLADGMPQLFDDAAAKYYRDLDGAGLSDAELQEANEAFARYLGVLGEASAPTELQKQALGAYRRYADVVEQSWSSSDRAERAAAAYRDYVRSIREAWAAVDEEALHATELAAMAQSMTMVAWTASLCGQQSRGAARGDLASAFAAAQPSFLQQGE
jgi:hypothetical protein